jgi:branched-chain amino acid transport system permease protein
VTKFLQLLVGGAAVGSRYALVALGFVVIFRATRIINFAQGGLVVLGAYLTYNARNTWGMPFWLAVLAGMALTALVGVLIDRVVLRRASQSPTFGIVITVGVLFILYEVCSYFWTTNTLEMDDPWGVDNVRWGDVSISTKDLWTMILTAGVLLGFFALFRYSRIGLAMRTTAIDREASLAQGINVNMVFATSWALSGAVAALAGATLASGPGQVTPSVGDIAFAALPAVILGGLDSPGGAVIGGLIIGITQNLTAGYQNDWVPSFGAGFKDVMPYIVMVIILLVRPYGLFGTKEVRRI